MTDQKEDQNKARKTGDRWKDTELGKLLLAKKCQMADDVRAVALSAIGLGERHLAQSGTAPTSFTLHDADHALRVCNQMYKIIPRETRESLSAIELFFLIGSAYFHDLGMSPEEGMVNRVFDFFEGNDPRDLPGDELEALKDWASKNGINTGSECLASQKNTKISRRNTAYYCRERHVAWGESWMKKHLSKFAIPGYGGWLDDLILICKSHHYEAHDLEKPIFDTKFLPPEGEAVNIRYLAMCLRVADILEFDPERTPEIVYSSREIAKESEIYWHKDHYISYSIDDRGNCILQATPPNAFIHKAIEEMSADIGRELNQCRILEDKRPTALSIKGNTYHRWALSGTLNKSITPNNQSYEYIDGSFRPDTQRMLEILSGENLYGNRLLAIRELIQNSMDGIRESVAYKLLESENPLDPDEISRVKNSHEISIKIFSDDTGDMYLSCSDNGIGMTKDIINNKLLVSGSSQYHKTAILQSKCRDRGFELERTGKFGIGVLSYFMISDLVKIETQRCQDAGDAETNGWVFTTEGIGTFGELRKAHPGRAGTTVTLRLKRQDAMVFSQYADLIIRYIRETMVSSSCVIKVIKESGRDSERCVMGPGWTTPIESIKSAQLSDVLKRMASISGQIMEVQDEDAPLPEAVVKRTLTSSGSAIEGYKRCLDSFQTDSIEIPIDDQFGLRGNCRIHIGYFNVPGGISLVYMDAKRENDNLVICSIDKGYYIQPLVEIVTSYKGIRSRLRIKSSESGSDLDAFPSRRLLSGLGKDLSIGLYVEIDIDHCENSVLSVDRSHFSCKIDTNAIIDKIKKHVTERVRDKILPRIPRDFMHINSAFFWGPFADKVPDVYWAVDKLNSPLIHERRDLAWNRLPYPMTCDWDLGRVILGDRAIFRGKPVSFVVPIPPCTKDNSGTSGWGKMQLVPDTMALCRQTMGGVKLIPVFLKSPIRRCARGAPACRFPRGWEDVSLAVDLRGGGIRVESVFFNKDNKCVKFITKQGVLPGFRDLPDDNRSIFASSVGGQEPEFKEFLLHIFHLIVSNNKDTYDFYTERHRHFLIGFFNEMKKRKLLSPKNGDAICACKTELGKALILTITETGWTEQLISRGRNPNVIFDKFSTDESDIMHIARE